MMTEKTCKNKLDDALSQSDDGIVVVHDRNQELHISPDQYIGDKQQHCIVNKVVCQRNQMVVNFPIYNYTAYKRGVF